MDESSRHLQASYLLKKPLKKIRAILLSYSFVRELMNSAYKDYNRRYINLIWRFFSTSEILSPFIWKDYFISREIKIPVFPEYPRSWITALACLWAEPAIRKFSKLYINHHDNLKEIIFFDVGSNHGIRSYPFLAYGVKCVMFEPQKECNRYVKKFAVLNNYKPIIEEYVVSDCAGTANFYVSASSYWSSLARDNVEKFEPATKVSVNCVTLDNYCAIRKMYPDLIKIDVEGYEWQVICGAEKVISNKKPTVIVEIWPNSGHKKEIYKKFIRLGYKCFAAIKDKIIFVGNIEQFDACKEPDYIFCAEQKIFSQLLL